MNNENHCNVIKNIPVHRYLSLNLTIPEDKFLEVKLLGQINYSTVSTEIPLSLLFTQGIRHQHCVDCLPQIISYENPPSFLVSSSSGKKQGLCYFRGDEQETYLKFYFQNNY